MNDVPGAIGATATCPACRSNRSERNLFGGLEYRCLSCGAMFDAYGSRVVLPTE